MFFLVGKSPLCCIVKSHVSLPVCFREAIANQARMFPAIARPNVQPMQSGLYCFYHVQGDKGDVDTHPNAFVLSSNESDAGITLEDFVKAFPLAGTAPFHFRFQVPSPAGKVYLDLTNPRDKIPVVNGSVIVKALRLGAYTQLSSPEFLFVSWPSL